MGFLDRMFGRSVALDDTVPATALPSAVLGGHETLEVVGESHYQDHLWTVAGGFRAEKIRHAIQAVLEPERGLSPRSLGADA
jgi:hypothetical protein